MIDQNKLCTEVHMPAKLKLPFKGIDIKGKNLNQTMPALCPAKCTRIKYYRAFGAFFGLYPQAGRKGLSAFRAFKHKRFKSLSPTEYTDELKKANRKNTDIIYDTLLKDICDHIAQFQYYAGITNAIIDTKKEIARIEEEIRKTAGEFGASSNRLPPLEATLTSKKATYESLSKYSELNDSHIIIGAQISQSILNRIDLAVSQIGKLREYYSGLFELGKRLNKPVLESRPPHERKRHLQGFDELPKELEFDPIVERSKMVERFIVDKGILPVMKKFRLEL